MEPKYCLLSSEVDLETQMCAISSQFLNTLAIPLPFARHYRPLTWWLFLNKITHHRCLIWYFVRHLLFLYWENMCSSHSSFKKKYVFIQQKCQYVIVLVYEFTQIKCSKSLKCPGMEMVLTALRVFPWRLTVWLLRTTALKTGVGLCHPCKAPPHTPFLERASK